MKVNSGITYHSLRMGTALDNRSYSYDYLDSSTLYEISLRRAHKPRTALSVVDHDVLAFRRIRQCIDSQ